MTGLEALQIIEDEIAHKGGHTWLEITEAGLVLGQLALEQIKKAGGSVSAHFDNSKTDPQHLTEAKMALGGGGLGGILKGVNWGNVLQIVLKVLQGLGPVLGGAPVAGS